MTAPTEMPTTEDFQAAHIEALKSELAALKARLVEAEQRYKSMLNDYASKG